MKTPTQNINVVFCCTSKGHVFVTFWLNIHFNKKKVFSLSWWTSKGGSTCVCVCVYMLIKVSVKPLLAFVRYRKDFAWLIYISIIISSVNDFSKSSLVDRYWTVKSVDVHSIKLQLTMIWEEKKRISKKHRGQSSGGIVK